MGEEEEEVSRRLTSTQSTQTSKSSYKNHDFYRLTLKDILKLCSTLLLPLVLGVFTVISTFQQRNIAEEQRVEDRIIAELQRNLERNLSTERYRQELFDTYIKEIGVLLLENNGSLTSNSVISTLARVKTLNLFRRMNSRDNIRIIRFLHETEQLSQTLKEPPLDLSSAKLQNIDFRELAINEKYLNKLSLASIFLYDSVFIHMELNDIIFSQNHFYTANFSSMTLRNGNFTHAYLNNIDFSHVHIKNADFSFAELNNVNFTSSQLFHVNFTASKLYNVDFSHNYIQDTDFSFSTLKNVKFTSSHLIDINFMRSTFNNVDFSSSQSNFIHLSYINFEGAQFHNVNFAFTKFYQAKFENTQHRNSNFSSSVLIISNFLRSNMPETIFEYTTCVKTLMALTNLSVSNFRYANVKYVNFEASDLRKANFEHANLLEANLKNTNITDHQLRSAISIRGANLNLTVNAYEPDLILNGEPNCSILLTEHWILKQGQVEVQMSEDNTNTCRFVLRSYEIGAIISQRIDISNKWDFNIWPRSQAVLNGNISKNVTIELRQINSKQEIHSRVYLKLAQQTIYIDLSNDTNELEVLIKFNASFNKTKDTKNWCSNVSLFIVYGTNSEFLKVSPRVPSNARWSKNGITIMKGNDSSQTPNILVYPVDIDLDGEGYLLIVDQRNHQVLEWKLATSISTVVAGGNGPGNQANQLNEPTNLCIETKTDTLIICDFMNTRMVRWPRRNGVHGEIIITKINCLGVAMDNYGLLYVSDYIRNEVRRYQIGDTDGIVVAGGNGKGNALNQLNLPSYIFVDEDYSVYIADTVNYRVMKWTKDAKEGTIIAQGVPHSRGMWQLSQPQGLFVDQLGTLYVSDFHNNRIVRWNNNASTFDFDIILAQNVRGDDSTHFNLPHYFIFDRYSNIYVADGGNARIQWFLIERD